MPSFALSRKPLNWVNLHQQEPETWRDITLLRGTYFGLFLRNPSSQLIVAANLLGAPPLATGCGC